MSDTPLAAIAESLEAVRIPYMVVGSFASAFHGEPRTTRDLDLVIDPSVPQLDAWLARLDPELFYFDRDVAHDALQRRAMFNVIEIATAWKVDLIVCKDREFSREELRRRSAVSMLGATVTAATAEDTIVAKLEWAKLGASQRQLGDVAGMLRVRGADLDGAYIQRWVTNLGLDDVWQQARALAR